MYKYCLLICTLFFAGKILAHPMPNSVVSLSILENSVKGEAKIPLMELQSAIGAQRGDNINSPFFKAYFTNHIAALSGQKKWSTTIDSLSVITTDDAAVGSYREVIVYFELTPSDKKVLRTFTFNYDAVIHQVITHKILVFVKEDWRNGIQQADNAQQIGIIKLDVPTEKIYPLQVNLEQGSLWKGFTKMLGLGMEHIKEGTDHLLFLIVLLLPCMLLTKGKRWGKPRGTKYGLTHLLKIVTAFTIGHSITLLAGALGWLKLPEQPVEILIAVSILISAIHAAIPIFPGKETFIAAGFGLIHGLAFAGVLSGLNLSASTLALSIMGFNIGIELMQLIIILFTAPWLILLAKTPVYKWIRVTGAILAAIAATAWILERSSGKPNAVTAIVERLAQHAGYCITGLAMIALVAYLISKPKKPVLSNNLHLNTLS